MKLSTTIKHFKNIVALHKNLDVIVYYHEALKYEYMENSSIINDGIGSNDYESLLVIRKSTYSIDRYRGSMGTRKENSKIAGIGVSWERDSRGIKVYILSLGARPVNDNHLGRVSLYLHYALLQDNRHCPYCTLDMNCERGTIHDP